MVLLPVQPTGEQRVRQGDVQMVVQWNAEIAAVAEPIKLSVQVEAPTGTTVSLPLLTESLGGLDVVQQQVVDAIPLTGRKGRSTWTLEAELRSIRSGEFRVPALEVRYQLRNHSVGAKQRSIRNRPFRVTIDATVPAAEDPTKFREIKQRDTGSPSAANSSSSITLATVAGLMTFGLVLLGLWYRRRRKTVDESWLGAEVDRLELLYHADPPQAYPQLSALVRQTIWINRRIHAFTKTREQVIESLRISNSSESLVSQVNQLLTLDDEAKFAGVIGRGESLDENVFQLTRSILSECGNESVGADGASK
jgi:hypothetical protein